MKRVKTLNGRKEKKKSKYFSSFSGRPWTLQKVKVGAVSANKVSVFQRLLHRCHGWISVVYFDQQMHANACIVVYILISDSLDLAWVAWKV